MTDAAARYSAVDAILTRYDVDVAAGTLTRRQSLRLSAKLQYAWPIPRGNTCTS